MTKEELLLGFAKYIQENGWDTSEDYFNPLGFNVLHVTDEIADAGDGGIEYYDVNLVSGKGMSFYYAVSYCTDRWDSMDTALFEVHPQQVVKHRSISENYVDKLWEQEND